MLAKPSVTLKRRINGKPAQVFAAWTDPQKIVRWFGPQQTLPDTVQAELDVRVGGKFWVGFRTEDGNFHKVGGTYREVFPHERLQFSWAWHSTPERESLEEWFVRFVEGARAPVVESSAARTESPVAAEVAS